MQSMLSLQHLTVSLGSSIVLRDVSIDIEPGEVVCIAGEEGSGKTTLLSLLTRELQPQEGVVKIDGAVLSHLPRDVLRLYRTRIGYLGHDSALDDSLTIAENIARPLDRMGTPAAERDRAVQDLLKRFGLTGIAGAFPDSASHGERRLAAIARTIVRGPFLIVLDEPFDGLSVAAATLAAGLLLNMRKKGATIIVASSDARTAGLFGNPRVATLHRGKLTEHTKAAPSPQQQPTRIVAEDIARIATAELVERSSDTAVTPSIPRETGEKKKVRITSVGSL
jgi:ABC-type multidrug transport system ATPase subunit